jgi:hypothetical protein
MIGTRVKVASGTGSTAIRAHLHIPEESLTKQSKSRPVANVRIDIGRLGHGYRPQRGLSLKCNGGEERKIERKLVLPDLSGGAWWAFAAFVSPGKYFTLFVGKRVVKSGIGFSVD